MTKRKPNGYWTDWKNLRRELQEVIDEIGHFPSSTELRIRGNHSISNSIQIHHGKINAVQKRMGYGPKRKPNGYWKEWKNVELGIQEVIEVIGHFPTIEELSDRSQNSLVTAINNYPGKINAVQKRMGYESKRKPYGYWKKWDNVKRELQEVIDEIGHFPTYRELSDRSQSSLEAAINNYHGKINAVQEKMGYGPKRKPNGYWRKWGNVEQEIRKMIDEIGHFPTSIEICRLSSSSLINSINTNHGKINAVRKRMGFEDLMKPNGYWKEWETIERAVQEVIDEIGHFPSGTELQRLNGAVCSGILKYHGKINAVRKRMGYELSRRPPGYWEKWENVEREVQEVIDKIGHFPTPSEFRNLNLSTLASAIPKYHRNMRSIQKRMGYEPKRKPNGYWKEWENLEGELQEVIDEIGHFPSQIELKNQGFSSIHSSIHKYHGNYSSVKERMGYGESANTKALEQLLESYVNQGDGNE